MYTVEVERSGVATAVHYRASVHVDRLGDDIGARMEELYEAIAEAGLTPAGPPSITYPDHPHTEADLLIELSAPVTAKADVPLDALARAGMELVTQGAVQMARIRHRGPYTSLGEAHLALEKWLAETGRHQAGPHRETYLIGPGNADDPHDYITDISVPVDAASGGTKQRNGSR